MLFSTLKPGGGGHRIDPRGYGIDAPGLFVLTRSQCRFTYLCLAVRHVDERRHAGGPDHLCQMGVDVDEKRHAGGLDHLELPHQQDLVWRSKALDKRRHVAKTIYPPHV